jgi:translation initiation factor 1A
VIKMLGNGRLEAFCFDGVSRLCHIRGKLRKRVWIQQGDIVLLGLRDFQDAKADVIQKYDNEEARSLKAYGELPENGAPAFPPSPNPNPNPAHDSPGLAAYT